jgi:hypothetical protein
MASYSKDADAVDIISHCYICTIAIYSKQF